MRATLWVAAGGALGSVSRYWLGEAFLRLGFVRFPWTTLVVNVSGSFLIGLLAALATASAPSPAGRVLAPFLMVGFCGGFTTFSAFSLQTLALLQAGDGARALANVAASLALCLAAVWLGQLAGAGLRGG